MNILVGTVLFIFGTIVGSFLNVVILRFNSGRGVTGRSGCLSCGKRLSWHELIPIVSFVALRGKCRGCRTPLSVQYPLVELATGILFTFAGLMLIENALILDGKMALSLGLLFAIISVLVVIFVYDLRHKIIPDLFAYAFFLLALGYSALSAGEGLGWTTLFSRLISAVLISLPFAFIFYVSRGRAMGLGDAKLALGIGALLGTSLGFTAVIFGFWVGAIVSLCLMVVQRLTHTSARGRLTFKSEVPFGPFLIIGIGIVFFTGINLFDFQSVLAISVVSF
ncbi:MAG: prepilin peptidase [Patescibacteria group bacterium]